MIDEKKWYRVAERSCPLLGCDVKVMTIGRRDWPLIVAMRRLDVFFGDRPYQVRATEIMGHLGIAVDPCFLEESPVQDDVVELATESPYGKCSTESELVREGSGLVLRYAHYERASQISLRDEGVGLRADRTFLSDDHVERVREAVDMFIEKRDADDIVERIGRDDGQEEG